MAHELFRAIGTADIVTFTFLDAVPDYYDDTSWVHDGFQAFDDQQREATRDLLAAISDFANITFVEVASANEATLTFGFADTGGTMGVVQSPMDGGIGTIGNDIWLAAYAANEAFVGGTFIFSTLMHEIGHTLGMGHPSITELPLEENNRQHTVMSGLDPISLGYEPETYMLYDIATLQYIYGANTASATGNDVYTFADFGSKLKTIWDAGGHDVFDLSAATYGVDIDLRQGEFSTVARWGHDNLAIAFGTVIEDVIGSNFDDTIMGNEVANRLTGGGGQDIFAFAVNWGNDTITDFARGADRLDFTDAGLGFADLDITSSGGDTLIAYLANSVTLQGVATIDESDFVFVA